MIQKIPQPVREILESLQKAGFEAFIVGGCVRDLLLGRAPKDWDITTDATPNETLVLFPDSFYENTFGTVGVKAERFLATTSGEKEYDIIEVTTYRTEANYEDLRRPSEVTFTKSLTEDLARRDFTINAMAAKPTGRAADTNTTDLEIIDPFGGQEDLKRRVVRTVGKPEDRFNEDALRLMRAIRFYTELSKLTYNRQPTTDNNKNDWRIEEATLAAITKLSKNLKAISLERIRDEFSKIILSGSPSEGVDLLQKTGLLRFIIPELETGIGVGQNLHHIYTVWEHNLLALKTCPSTKLSVRLAALLHDIGKPATKRGNGLHSTFYNHDHVGARMTRTILTRLRYPKDIVEHSTLLVDNHLFYYNVGEVTEASVRRLIQRVGLENMDDLMAVRIGDRLGSGVPKAKPYKLRHLEYMIDKVSRDPISVKMLAVNGTDLISVHHIPTGPKIGTILDVLLAEVIEDPTRNTTEYLSDRVEALKDSSLENLRKKAKEIINERCIEDDKDIKKKHWVE